MPEDKLSFIPQKKSEPSLYRERGPGALIIISLSLFVLSGLIYGGLLIYKSKVQQETAALTDSLTKATAGLEISTINQLQTTSQEIGTIKNLLDQHIAATPIFDLLQKDTLKSIVFTSFKYSLEDGSPVISLEGTVPDYTTLALQGVVFEGDSSIKDFSFSNLTLGEKGIVNFVVKLTLDPSIISYKAE